MKLVLSQRCVKYGLDVPPARICNIDDLAHVGLGCSDIDNVDDSGELYTTYELDDSTIGNPSQFDGARERVHRSTRPLLYHDLKWLHRVCHGIN